MFPQSKELKNWQQHGTNKTWICLKPFPCPCSSALPCIVLVQLETEEVCSATKQSTSAPLTAAPPLHLAWPAQPQLGCSPCAPAARTFLLRNQERSGSLSAPHARVAPRTRCARYSPCTPGWDARLGKLFNKSYFQGI